MQVLNNLKPWLGHSEQTSLLFTTSNRFGASVGHEAERSTSSSGLDTYREAFQVHVPATFPARLRSKKIDTWSPTPRFSRHWRHCAVVQRFDCTSMTNRLFFPFLLRTPREREYLTTLFVRCNLSSQTGLPSECAVTYTCVHGPKHNHTFLHSESAQADNEWL